MFIVLKYVIISFSSGKLLSKKNKSSVSILRFCFLVAKMFDFLENLKSLKLHILQKVKHFDREKSPSLHILKKTNILMPKVYKTCMYSKIIKSFDSEKSPNLHILKKNYFTSSDPHHDMSGGGCQVGVVRVNWKCYLRNLDNSTYHPNS